MEEGDRKPLGNYLVGTPLFFVSTFLLLISICLLAETILFLSTYIGQKMDAQ